MLVLPLADAGTGGGTVGNVAAEAVDLSNDGTTLDVGHSDVLVGSVRDANRIADLVSLKLSVTDPDGTTTDDTATLSGISGGIPTAKPSSENLGSWTIWDGTVDDGVLDFEYAPSSYATAGDYTWVLSAADEAGFGPTTQTLVVTVVQKIKAFAQTVDDAKSDAGETWGGWTAVPTDTAPDNIESETWLKIENTGTTATQAFTVSFSGDFQRTGGTTPIDVHGNLEFAAVFDPDGSVDLSTADPTWEADSNSDGAHTFSFSNTGSFAYVKYRIVDIPALLEDGTYEASFTVDAA